MKIDVCCCTKNAPLPEWWYRAVYNHLPVNKIIIDETVPLGQSRRNAIQEVESDWFLFLDDDVLVSPHTFGDIEKFIAPDVGAVAAREQIFGFGEEMDRQLNTLRWSKGTMTLKPGDRGVTVCTLIRTELVKDWTPDPWDVSAWEDYLISNHIMRKKTPDGDRYKWLWVNANVLHLSWSWSAIPPKCLWHGRGLKKVKPGGVYYPPVFIPRLIVSPFKNLLISFLKVGDNALNGRPLTNGVGFRSLAYQFWQNFWIIVGVILG